MAPIKWRSAPPAQPSLPPGAWILVKGQFSVINYREQKMKGTPETGVFLQHCQQELSELTSLAWTEDRQGVYLKSPTYPQHRLIVV